MAERLNTLMLTERRSELSWGRLNQLTLNTGD